MKRLSAFILALICCLPVISLGAAAKEVYVFYPFEVPVALDDSFDFIVDSDSDWFLFEGVLPEGSYSLSVSMSDDYNFLDFRFISPVLISHDPGFEFFDYYCSGSCDVSLSFDDEIVFTSFTYNFLVFDSVSMLGFFAPDTTDVRFDLSLFSALNASSVSSTQVLVMNTAQIITTSFSLVSDICSTIVNNSFLLMCAGILLLGGSIGITGRLFSRN